MRANTRVECTFLSLNAIAVGWKSRRTLIHADERDAGLLFKILSHKQSLANGGMREVGNVVDACRLIDQFVGKYFHADNLLPVDKMCAFVVDMLGLAH